MSARTQEETVDPTAWPSSYYGRTRHIDLAKFFHDIQNQLTQDEPTKRRVSFSVKATKTRQEGQGDYTSAWLEHMADDWQGRRRSSAPASLAPRSTLEEGGGKEEEQEEQEEDEDEDEEEEDEEEEEEDLLGWNDPLCSVDHHYIRRCSDGLYHMDLRPIPNQEYERRRGRNRTQSVPLPVLSPFSSEKADRTMDEDSESEAHWPDDDSSTFGLDEYASMFYSYQSVNVLTAAKKQLSKTYLARTWTRLRKSSLTTLRKRLSIKGR
ncbi:hypothetical protein EC973_003189 [Apophysomyces ossiformis]|uniref:Uncharacterized protein n=1 Tax=Apophysomyces ossiformis TaxID=679940 RepID=A0A8H7EN64_9FUNG|nr:hypothetical protein EC973_003189 [Apophysomyces ossiformis]